MFIRRITFALLGAFMMLSLTAAPAAAKKPTPPQPDGERPLTAEEQAASEAKVAAAEIYLASTADGEADLVTLNCVAVATSTINAAAEPSGLAIPDGATDPDAATAPDASTAACTIPSAYLPVYARDQIRGHYCGPAVGQVIANYSWAMASTANKYTQTTIAGWMKTDVFGLTNAPELRDGLNRATAGAPRRPSNWAWVVTPLRDTNGNGTVADQLHGYVKSNVSFSKMPLAIPVKPHASTSKYHLSSWSRPVNSPGHWIAAYGWYAHWTNTDVPRIYYTDSSRDEGGSTGKFWDPTRHIAALIMEHTRRFVW